MGGPPWRTAHPRIPREQGARAVPLEWHAPLAIPAEALSPFKAFAQDAARRLVGIQLSGRAAPDYPLLTLIFLYKSKCLPLKPKNSWPKLADAAPDTHVHGGCCPLPSSPAMRPSPQGCGEGHEAPVHAHAV